MIMKFGKIQVVCNEGDYGFGGNTFEAEVLIQNIANRNHVYFTVVSDSKNPPVLPYQIEAYRGVNPETEEGLMKLLYRYAMPNGVKSYKWLEPLAEVPSQGGSSLTIDDVYPVGIEITTTDTTFNPMKVWGGTWTVSPAGAKRVWTRTA